jgi:twinkle protein
VLNDLFTNYNILLYNLQINIILVIHPKKDDDKLPLGISSVFGTAKATQEADAVMILQVSRLHECLVSNTVFGQK